jgi:hypothetical protein
LALVTDEYALLLVVVLQRRLAKLVPDAAVFDAANLNA